MLLSSTSPPLYSPPKLWLLFQVWKWRSATAGLGVVETVGRASYRSDRCFAGNGSIYLVLNKGTIWIW